MGSIETERAKSHDTHLVKRKGFSAICIPTCTKRSVFSRLTNLAPSVVITVDFFHSQQLEHSVPKAAVSIAVN